MDQMRCLLAKLSTRSSSNVMLVVLHECSPWESCCSQRPRVRGVRIGDCSGSESELPKSDPSSHPQHVILLQRPHPPHL